MKSAANGKLASTTHAHGSGPQRSLDHAGHLFVGTHRRAHRADPNDIAFGIYGFSYNERRAELKPTGLTATEQPGWLAVHPSGATLYAVNEVRKIAGHEGGAICAYSIDTQTGMLTLLNSAPLPPMPCHCQIDVSGRYLLATTFDGGSVHVFELANDGSIKQETDRHFHHGSSRHPKRQTSPHAHAAICSPDNRFIFVPDLGIDRIIAYRFDDNGGRLHPEEDLAIDLPPLSGPRHGIFSPDGSHFYLVAEMSATAIAYSYDRPTGRLTHRQSVDLMPDRFEGHRSGAAIGIHPNGKHLYVTTRSHGSSGMPASPGIDALVWFTISPEDGHLCLGGRMASGGAIPRCLTLSPCATRLYITHQCSGSISEFLLEGGVPVPSNQSWQTPVPVCCTFAP